LYPTAHRRWSSAWSSPSTTGKISMWRMFKDRAVKCCCLCRCVGPNRRTYNRNSFQGRFYKNCDRADWLLTFGFHWSMQAKDVAELQNTAGTIQRSAGISTRYSSLRLGVPHTHTYTYTHTAIRRLYEEGTYTYLEAPEMLGHSPTAG
jgi:hypothetical protein